MNNVKDPPRLFESSDAPSDLRHWLQLAHGDVLSGAEAEALAQLVEQQSRAMELTQPRQGVGSGSIPKLSRLGRLVLKALVPVAVVGLGLGGWSWVNRRHVTAVDAAPPLPGTTLTTATLSSAAYPGVGLRPNTQVSSSPELEPARSEPARSEPKPTNSTPPRAAQVGRRSGVSPTVTKAHADVASPQSTQTDEYSLLAAARRATSANPAHALGLAEQHARFYPGGMLGQEREAIAIEALVNLGKTALAKARAQQFIQRYPGSPHRSRVEALLRRKEAKP